MKRQSIGRWAAVGICIAFTSSAFAQTTTTRGTPTISGFAPNPVSGYNASPVTGFTPAPIQGLGQAPAFPVTTNFTTGPISPLSTRIAQPGTNPIFISPPAVPQVVVPPTPNSGNVIINPTGTNVMTPLF